MADARWNFDPCARALGKADLPLLAPALAWAQQNEETGWNALRELIAIPSISNKPGHEADLERAAQRGERYLKEIGLTQVRRVNIPGANPFILAETKHNPALPTVMFYNHFDVVDVDDASNWKNTPPFQMTRIGDKIYGRGIVDNKGGIVIAGKVIEAIMLASNGNPPVNIKFILESEEEIGSPHMQELLEQESSFFSNVDATVILDGSNANSGIPTVTTSLRGLLFLDIKVRSLAEGGVHAGVWGGVVPNPLEALVGGLASLTRKGRIMIPGFYDHVIPMSPAEEAGLRALWPSDAAFAGAAGMVPGAQLRGDPNLPIVYRLARLPALYYNIKESAGGLKAIPPEANAELAVRVHPGSDPKELLEKLKAFLRANIDSDLPVEFSTPEEPSSPWSVSREHPLLKLAGQALQQGYGGKETIFTGDGASLPLAAKLEEATSGGAVVMLGIDDPESRSHGNQENLNLGTFRGNRDALIAYIIALGHATPHPH